MQIKVGTRKSPLALKQTALACHWIDKRLSDFTYEIIPVNTEIDSHLNYSLETQGGIGLFTKELDAALLDESIDLAVHSSKDLPIHLNPELEVIGYLPRASAFDVLISNKSIASIENIATSSPRRKEQLKSLFPNAHFSHIRGNVETRLKKLSNKEADATLLAEAGLDRLDINSFGNLNFTTIEPKVMVPAAGQGAIAIVSRKDSMASFELKFCEKTDRAISFEKEILAVLDGGCQSPAGVYFDGSHLHLFEPRIGYRCFHMNSETFSEFHSTTIKAIKEIKELL